MKRHTMWVGALAAGWCCLALPAGAVSMPQCSALSQDVGTARNNVSAAENDAQMLITDLDSLAGYVQIPLDIQADVKKVRSSADTVSDLLSDLALLAELVPEIAEPLNSTSQAVSTLTENVINPTDNTISDIVDTLRLQQIEDALNSAASAINTYAKQPLDRSRNDLQQVLNVTNDAILDVNRLPSGACQNRVAQAVNNACGPIDQPVSAVDQTTSTVVGTINTVSSDVNRAVQAFSPFNQIRRDLESIKGSLDSIANSLRGMRSLLHHKIYIKVMGITVAKFSVQEVLDDWNHLVKEVERWLHISNAEAWLRKEIGKIMKSEVRALKREINGLVRANIPINFDLSSVTSLMNKIQNELASVKAEIRSDIATMTNDMKNAANQDCQ